MPSLEKGLQPPRRDRCPLPTIETRLPGLCLHETRPLHQLIRHTRRIMARHIWLVAVRGAPKRQYHITTLFVTKCPSYLLILINCTFFPIATSYFFHDAFLHPTTPTHNVIHIINDRGRRAPSTILTIIACSYN